MNKTTVLCDICGKECAGNEKIDFRMISGKEVNLLLFARIGTSRGPTQLDICQPCATKIEKFLANMEKDNDGNN